MNDHPTCPRPTADEQAAIDQAERTLSFKNGRYEIGVPWKRNEPKFSDNYELVIPETKKLRKIPPEKRPEDQGNIQEDHRRLLDKRLREKDNAERREPMVTPTLSCGERGQVDHQSQSSV